MGVYAPFSLLLGRLHVYMSTCLRTDLMNLSLRRLTLLPDCSFLFTTIKTTRHDDTLPASLAPQIV